MEELQRRSEEVLETFRAEATRHELVVVLEQTDPPIVAYAVEDEDFSRAHYRDRERRVAADSVEKLACFLGVLEAPTQW